MEIWAVVGPASSSTRTFAFLRLGARRGQVEFLRGVLWRGQLQDRADQFSCRRLSPSTKLFGGWDMRFSIFHFILEFRFLDSLDSAVSIEAMGFHPNVASVMHR